MSSPAQSIPFLVPCPVGTGEPKDGYADKETLFRIRTNFLQRQARDPGGNGYLTDEEASWLFTTLESAWAQDETADLQDQLKGVEDELKEAEDELKEERQARQKVEQKLKALEADLKVAQTKQPE